MFGRGFEGRPGRPGVPTASSAPNPFMFSFHYYPPGYGMPHPSQGPFRPPPPYNREWSPPTSSWTSPGLHTPRRHPAWDSNTGRSPPTQTFQPPPAPRMSHRPPPSSMSNRRRRPSQHTTTPMQPQQGTVPPRPMESRRLVSIPRLPMNLPERPEDVIFSNRQDLSTAMVRIFRPLVRVIARIMKEELLLWEEPPVKFDMYPMRSGERGPYPVINQAATSRAPMFQITLPFPNFTPNLLQEAVSYLRDYIFTNSHNRWYIQPGYIFRFSRQNRTEDRRSRRRFWIRPTCVWKHSRSRQGYRAQKVKPAIQGVDELTNMEGFKDTSDDDNEMREEMKRTRPYPGPYIVS
ncbi:hypothetical protein F4776DRAFT_600691, partial [Hypoxylon sp. NC0597]